MKIRVLEARLLSPSSITSSDGAEWCSVGTVSVCHGTRIRGRGGSRAFRQYFISDTSSSNSLYNLILSLQAAFQDSSQNASPFEITGSHCSSGGTHSNARSLRTLQHHLQYFYESHSVLLPTASRVHRLHGSSQNHIRELQFSFPEWNEDYALEEFLTLATTRASASLPSVVTGTKNETGTYNIGFLLLAQERW